MAKTVGVFDFQIWGGGEIKTGELPSMPVVALRLKRFTKWETGVPIITPQLAIEGEIDAQVRLLQADLEAAGERAKAALRKAQSRS